MKKILYISSIALLSMIACDPDGTDFSPVDTSKVDLNLDEMSDYGTVMSGIIIEFQATQRQNTTYNFSVAGALTTAIDNVDRPHIGRIVFAPVESLVAEARVEVVANYEGGASSTLRDTVDIIPFGNSIYGPTGIFAGSSDNVGVANHLGSTYVWSTSGSGASIGEGNPATPNIANVVVAEGTANGEIITVTVTETNAAGGTLTLEIEVVALCSPMPGTYQIDMHDTWGDGWQTNGGNGGNGIQVTLNDGTVLEVGMCTDYEDSPYGGCVAGDGSDATTYVTIPVGTLSALWYFPGDAYGEISFEVYAPSGEELFVSGSPGALGAGNFVVLKCK